MLPVFSRAAASGWQDRCPIQWRCGQPDHAEASRYVWGKLRPASYFLLRTRRRMSPAHYCSSMAQWPRC